MSDTAQALSILRSALHGDEELTHGQLEQCIDAINALREDKARLDWLEANTRSITIPTDDLSTGPDPKPVTVIFQPTSMMPLRLMVDGAMAK